MLAVPAAAADSAALVALVPVLVVQAQRLVALAAPVREQRVLAVLVRHPVLVVLAQQPVLVALVQQHLASLRAVRVVPVQPLVLAHLVREPAVPARRLLSRQSFSAAMARSTP
jgi:hypothetical protein